MSDAFRLDYNDGKTLVSAAKELAAAQTVLAKVELAKLQLQILEQKCKAGETVDADRQRVLDNVDKLEHWYLPKW